MKYDPLILIIFLYVSIQLMGLQIGHGLTGKIESGEISPVVGEPENPLSSLIIFFYILVGTTILLLLMKYGLDSLIKIFTSIFIIFGLVFTLWSLFDSTGFLLAAIFLAISALRGQDPAVMNIVLLFTIPGIGALFGSSLAFVPALILILLLSAYDLVAVFGTKHMVTLAEGAKGKIPLMFSIPFGDRYLGLGTGDLAIPLIFSVSVMRDYSFTNALFTAAGGLLGIALLFVYILNKKEAALPALPPICAGLITGFGFGFLIL